MATKAANEANAGIFQWMIKNNQMSSIRKGMKSPDFIAEALEHTKWTLWLFPMGDNENYISIYLNREIDCSGPDAIEVTFQFAFLGKDDSILTKKASDKRSFTKNINVGFSRFETREKVFVTEKETYFPEDTLTVQCMIWKKEETPMQAKRLYARTNYKTNKGSFRWKIYDFNTIKPSLQTNFKDNLIDFDLILNKQIDIEKNLEISINSFDENVKYFSFKTVILDSEGKEENCGVYEYVPEDLKKGILSMPLDTKKVMENKSRYLPNDVLCVDCEYVIFTKTVLHYFLKSGVIFPKLTNEEESKNEHCVGRRKSQNASVLVSDLKSLYIESILCDTELRTSTRKFPAHKNILSARSPVFRRMFDNDMKEKNSGHVDITDLEDDTVQRMLMYIYSDSLEDLELESASKLYAAADKYEILHLRNLCSCFLKENLCPTNACDVLALADLHQDDDLKSFVKDYILDHDKEVFGSQEWKDFMGNNSKLAADIMYMKVFPA